jgi:hypothetical protein
MIDNLPPFENTPEQIAALAGVEAKVVPGRHCGSCSLCCKVLDVPELQKPPGEWCKHMAPGRGCAMHEVRPFVCRAFYCEWIIARGLGPEWKPDKARFVLVKRGRRLTAHVDRGVPGAWQKAPYYENFKSWAADGARQDPMHRVDVMIGQRLIVVLPDRDVDLGTVAEGDEVAIERQAGGALSVRVMPSGAGAQVRVSA